MADRLRTMVNEQRIMNKLFREFIKAPLLTITFDKWNALYSEWVPQNKLCFLNGYSFWNFMVWLIRRETVHNFFNNFMIDKITLDETIYLVVLLYILWGINPKNNQASTCHLNDLSLVHTDLGKCHTWFIFDKNRLNG